MLFKLYVHPYFIAGNDFFTKFRQLPISLVEMRNRASHSPLTGQNQPGGTSRPPVLGDEIRTAAFKIPMR